jgi:hypothetical protein
VAVPSGEEAEEEAPAALVGPGDETVDRLVLTRDGPVGFPTTGGAGTAMDHLVIIFMGLGHHPLPP